MAHFAKDLTGQNTAIIRDMFVTNDTYRNGEFMCAGVTDDDNLGSLISVEDESAYKGFVGLCNEPIVAAGNSGSSNTDTAKVVINPFGCWMAEYDTDAISTVTTYGSTTTILFACTSDKGYENGGGYWIYRNAGAGDGELNYIQKGDLSTTTCTLTFATATAATTTSEFIILLRQGQVAIPLSYATIDSDELDGGYETGGTYAYPGFCLETYITTDAYTRRPLRCSTDDTKEGRHTTNMDITAGLQASYNGSDPKFESLINLFRCSAWMLDSGVQG